VDVNRKKYVGREFLQRMTNVSDRPQAFDTALKEFTNAPSDNRTEVAIGLLAIGADDAEPTFNRGFALSVLATIIRVCGLRNSEEMEDELSGIVDRQGRSRNIGQMKGGDDPSVVASRQVQKGALLALTAVNRSVGLQRLDRLIEQHGDSEFGRELSELRSTLSRRD